MKKTAYKTHEKDIESLVLIVDKIGVIGEALALEFSKDFHVVFVTRRPLPEKNEKISQVLFKTKIPKVPQNKYSKIFLIDDGDSVTRESAFSFISRSKQTDAHFYFLGSLRNFDVEHADEISRSYSKTKVLIFGDLFDKETLFDNSTSITKFIIGARSDKKIKVPKDGLAINYPVSLEDTIKLIIRATYLDIPQKTILLFYQHGVTDISLAHMFQKIDPDIKVDFTNEEIEHKIYIPAESSYALTKYDVKKKLGELGLEKGTETIRVEEPSRNINLKYFKYIAFFVFACVFLFLLPLITTESYILLGFNQLESAKNLAGEGDFEKALKRSNNAKTFFTIAEKTESPLATQAKLMGMGDRVKKIEKEIDAGQNLSSATSNLLSGSIILKKVLSGKSADSNNDLREGLDSIKSSDQDFQKIKTQGQIPANIGKILENIVPLLDLISNASDVMPKAMGFDQSKKYLVIFQDNTNIRPGGGEISAVGLLTLRNGKIDKFKISDVSSLDEKLNTHVEPPYPIRRYMPSQDLYLRDSNFDPDFVISAISAASLYKLETKDEVDGVVGVDLSFAKDLLNSIGKVKFDGKEIGPENIYQEVDENSGERFFFEKLISAIITKFANNDKKQYLLISEAIGKGILEKHVLFAFKDQDIQNIFITNNLSGSLVDNREPEDGNVNDFFGISEANLGLNGENYFVSRSISKEVIIGDGGQFGSVATLAFKNNGSKEYKNYIQLILPQGTKINEVSVGGKKVDVVPAITDFLVYEKKGFVAPKELEIEQKTVAGKNIFGFYVLVPGEGMTTIKITYLLPFVLSQKTNSIKYGLYVYKQPGIDSYPFELTFNAPDDVSVLPNDSYSGEIRKDEELNFLISSK